VRCSSGRGCCGTKHGLGILSFVSRVLRSPTVLVGCRDAINNIQMSREGKKGEIESGLQEGVFRRCQVGVWASGDKRTCLSNVYVCGRSAFAIWRIWPLQVQDCYVVLCAIQACTGTGTRLGHGLKCGEYICAVYIYSTARAPSAIAMFAICRKRFFSRLTSSM
jgi:hypothetical protein